MPAGLPCTAQRFTMLTCSLLTHSAGRYQAGADLFQLCAEADLLPCIFLRRLLEVEPWHCNKQVQHLTSSFCTVSALHGGHALSHLLQPTTLKVLSLIKHIHRTVTKHTFPPSLCAYIHAASCMQKTYSYIPECVSFLLHACRNQHCITTGLVTSRTCNNHSHGAVQSTGVHMHLHMHMRLHMHTCTCTCTCTCTLHFTL